MKRTKRLFDADPTTVRFDATVLACQANGDVYEVVLDRTAFFPDEGGQPCDTGVLGSVEVSAVSEREGVIFHTVKHPLVVGAVVTGEILSERRLRHMQNHTGEHILSAILHRHYGLHNVGFHLGKDDVTADFDGELTAQEIAHVEMLANRIVCECHPVRGYYPEASELAHMEYRSKLELAENVRIVEIEGVDRCACCAPHVSNTGEVGLIKILQCVRYKGGVRIHLCCGYDALAAFCAEHEQIRAICSALSVKHGEAHEGVARLLEEHGRVRGECAALKRKLFDCKLAQIEQTEGNLCLFEEEDDPAVLRYFLNGAKEKCGGVCALFRGDDEKGYKYMIASRYTDLRSMAGEINRAIFGRGGGSSEMIQGSCTATRAQICTYFQV